MGKYAYLRVALFIMLQAVTAMELHWSDSYYRTTLRDIDDASDEEGLEIVKAQLLSKDPEKLVDWQKTQLNKLLWKVNVRLVQCQVQQYMPWLLLVSGVIYYVWSTQKRRKNRISEFGRTTPTHVSPDIREARIRKFATPAGFYDPQGASSERFATPVGSCHRIHA